MFEYTRGNGWKEIEDILAYSEGKEPSDERSDSGYNPFPDLQIGDPDCGLSIDIYSKAITPVTTHKLTEEYDFLISLDIGSCCYDVVVPAVPDLLAFLKEVVPVTSQVANLFYEKERNNVK